MSDLNKHKLIDKALECFQGRPYQPSHDSYLNRMFIVDERFYFTVEAFNADLRYKSCGRFRFFIDKEEVAFINGFSDDLNTQLREKLHLLHEVLQRCQRLHWIEYNRLKKEREVKALESYLA